MAVAEKGFDFAEVLADAARKMLSAGRQKGLGFAFDTCMPSGGVRGDALDLQCGLYRLLHGAQDLLAKGFVSCHAHGRLGPRRLQATVVVAGAGVPAAPGATDEVLARLALKRMRLAEGERLVRARGRCPRTGAEISFSALGGEAFVIKFRHTLPFEREEQEPPAVDARQAGAWVIDADEAAGHVLARRLQRLGWATRTFPSPGQALARLRLLPPGHPRPALVIGIESTSVDAASLCQLVALLPQPSRCVLGVVAGSASLCQSRERLGVETHLLPFSAADLAWLTAGLSPSACTAECSRPAPLLLHERPQMLVVDDDETNRVVGAGLAETLGFEARVVADARQALDACLKAPPDIVLMDLRMPGVDGLTAARRLRELQRCGQTPPFPILAASAHAGPETWRDCREAGIDGCLPKPLFKEALKAECRRLLGQRVAHG